MDEVDSAIVRHLQEDARQSNREIAEKIGIAPSTCLERTRLLRQRGVIRGYHAEIDLPALNRHVQALVSVQVRPLNRSIIDSFHQWVQHLPEVLTVFGTAGNDDFLLHVAVRDIDQLHAFLVDKLSDRRDIVSFRSSIIYRRDTNNVLDPL